MNNIEQPAENKDKIKEIPETKLPAEAVTAFEKLGIKKEKLHFSGLMRSRTYRVEVREKNKSQSFVYKEIGPEHGRTLDDIIQDRNASKILDQIGYPTRKLLILEPPEDPKYAILDFVEGKRGGTNQNELLSAENVLLIAEDLKKIYTATETNFFSRSNEKIPTNENEIPYQEFCIGHSINDIMRLDIPQKSQIIESIQTASKKLIRGKFALIHADINQFNIVWKDSKPILIDWGYSEFGDPSRDIANLLLHIHKDKTGEFEKVYNLIQSIYGDFSKQINNNFKFYLGLRYLIYGRVGLTRAGDPSAIKLVEKGHDILKEFSKE